MTKVASEPKVPVHLADRIDLADKGSVTRWMTILAVSKVELATLIQKWGNSGAVISLTAS